LNYTRAGSRFYSASTGSANRWAFPGCRASVRHASSLRNGEAALRTNLVGSAAATPPCCSALAPVQVAEAPSFVGMSTPARSACASAITARTAIADDYWPATSCSTLSGHVHRPLLECFNDGIAVVQDERFDFPKPSIVAMSGWTARCTRSESASRQRLGMHGPHRSAWSPTSRWEMRWRRGSRARSPTCPARSSPPAGRIVARSARRWSRLSPRRSYRAAMALACRSPTGRSCTPRAQTSSPGSTGRSKQRES